MAEFSIPGRNTFAGVVAAPLETLAGRVLSNYRLQE